MKVTDTLQIVGPDGLVFSPQATSVTEGFKKDITKIMLPVDPEDSQNSSEGKDRTLFLDLMKITHDLNISGYLTDGDIPNKTTEEIVALLKSWMRSGKLVKVNYRGTNDYGARDTEEGWIIENCVFDDAETERTAAEEETSDYLATQIIKVKFSIKMVLGVLAQDYGF